MLFILITIHTQLTDYLGINEGYCWDGNELKLGHGAD